MELHREKNRYCLGDEVLKNTGLKAWSNGTIETHYTALYFPVMLLVTFLYLPLQRIIIKMFNRLLIRIYEDKQAVCIKFSGFLPGEGIVVCFCWKDTSVISAIFIDILCQPDQKFNDLLHGFNTDEFMTAVEIMSASAKVRTRQAHVG